MRQNFTFVLLLFCGFFGFAQLYVQQGATVGLGSSDAVITSQEQIHQIDTPIQGSGVLLLNGSHPQLLTSTQEVLEISNLALENAHLVRINTPLRVEQSLTVQSGVLNLEHPLYLSSPSALVLLENSAVKNAEFVVYDLQIERSQPLLVWNNYPLKYTTPILNKNSYQPLKKRSNFGVILSSCTTLYLPLRTPPPEPVQALLKNLT